MSVSFLSGTAGDEDLDLGRLAAEPGQGQEVDLVRRPGRGPSGRRAAAGSRRRARARRPKSPALPTTRTCVRRSVPSNRIDTRPAGRGDVDAVVLGGEVGARWRRGPGRSGAPRRRRRGPRPGPGPRLAPNSDRALGLLPPRGAEARRSACRRATRPGRGNRRARRVSCLGGPVPSPGASRGGLPPGDQLTYASDLPSGDQAGWNSRASSAESCFGLPSGRSMHVQPSQRREGQALAVGRGRRGLDQASPHRAVIDPDREVQPRADRERHLRL